ncbi:internal head protein [Xanthomonas phage RTH11]|nr:internal head protein [Xanthomonas phage RTH11]
MKNTRIAAQLRSLSLKPSLESDEQSTIETGPDGEGVVKQKLDEDAASPNQTTEETTPAENKDLTTTTTEVGERSELESAETTAAEDGENVVVSTEGFKGAFKAFGKTWSIGLRNIFNSNLGIAKAFAKFDVEQKREAEKLKQQIERIAARINAYHEGDIEKAKAEGLSTGPVKDLDDDQMMDAILKGGVVPFYTTYYGHKVESLEKELNAKLNQLNQLLKSNGVSMEGEGDEGEGSEIETGPGSEGVVKATVDASAETPNQTTEETTPVENEDVTAKTVDVGERSDLESAQTEITAGEGDVVVSTEGFKGAFNAAGKVWNAHWKSIFKNEGFFKANKRMSQIDIDQKRQAEKLKQQIEALAARISAYHEGDVEKAKAEGLSTGSTKPLSDDQVIDAVLKGRMIPFYTTYYGHKVESLDKQFQAKLKELDTLLKAGNVSVESYDDAGVEAAQAFADGAAGAAAAAAQATEGGDGEQAAAVEVVEEAAAVVEDVTDAVDPDAEEDAAIEAGRAELDGLDAEIADGEAHVEEYEQAEATLESLIEALQDAQASGGLTRQAARFATISFESIGVRLTGRPFVNAQGDNLMPSLESFGTTMRRDEATTVSLEGAKEVLQQVWEVLKKTFTTIKDWIVKFVKAVFDQGERYNQRADKVLAAAAKAGSAPKSQTVKFSGASKVAIGSEVSLAGLDVLVKIATEAGVRSSDASRAIMAARQGMNNAMQAAGDIEKVREQLLNIGREAGANAAAGAFRSEVFSKDAEVEGKKGYSTDVLPGNITLVNVDPMEEDNAFKAIFYMAKGGRVTVVADPNAGEVNSEQKTLSAEEIKTVANKVKAVVAAAAKSKSELKEEALDFGNINVPENTPDEVANLFKTNAKSLGKLLHISTGSIAKLLKYSVGTSGYYLDYANASLKQYGAAIEGEATKPEAAEAAAA